jgi:hypothetical protein
MYAKKNQHEGSYIGLWSQLEPLAIGCSEVSQVKLLSIVHCPGYSEVIFAIHLQNPSLSLFRFFSESLSHPHLYRKTPFEAHTAIPASFFPEKILRGILSRCRQVE